MAMRYSTDKPYVVISGLPGSGKSTLARRLAPLLKLPIIDKDDILERLFKEKGIGDKACRPAEYVHQGGSGVFEREV